MKKLLIAVISVFVLTNISFAQSTIKQKIDSLQNMKAKKEKELAKVNQELNLAKAEQEAKMGKAEKLYKERYPEFELAGIGLDGLKSVIVDGLARNPNWKLIDIQYKKFDADIRIKSTPDYREYLHFWEWWYAERAKLAWEWHKNPKEYKPLFAMQRYVKNYINGFLGSYYGEDSYEIDNNYDYVFKNKIINSKCKTIKIYYQELPENSFVKFHYYDDGTSFVKLENPLLSVKCFVEGKEKPIEILDPRSGAFMLSSGTSADIAKSDPFIDDSNIYVYKGKLLERITGRVKCDKKYREGEEPKFEKVPVDSLPKKHLKTFEIEDYK